MPNVADPLYLILDYQLPLAQLREFLCLAHREVSDDDLVDFFQRLVSNYFLKLDEADPRNELYELVGAEADALEAHGRIPEMVAEIFESIDEITRRYLPHYNLMSCGYGIEDCQPRGKSTTFVIELDRQYLPTEPHVR